MSDEEKKAIEIIKFLEDKCIQENETGMMSIYRIDELAKAIETILNFIEKQQKEIEELKNGQIDFWISDKEIEERIRNKFVNKDKIKAKIEEYEDYGTSIYYGLRSNGKAFHQAVRIEVKEILQSLLEKE